MVTFGAMEIVIFVFVFVNMLTTFIFGIKEWENEKQLSGNKTYFNIRCRLQL